MKKKWSEFWGAAQAPFFPQAFFLLSLQLRLPSFPYCADPQEAGSLLPKGTYEFFSSYASFHLFQAIFLEIHHLPSKANLLTLWILVSEHFHFFFYYEEFQTYIKVLDDERHGPHPSPSFNNCQLKAKPVSCESLPAPIMPHASNLAFLVLQQGDRFSEA